MDEDQDYGDLIASSLTQDVESDSDGDESEESVDDGPVFGETGEESGSAETGVSVDALAAHVDSIDYPHPEPGNNTRCGCELADVEGLDSPYDVVMTLVSGATVEVRFNPADPDILKVIYTNKAGQHVTQDTTTNIGGVAVTADNVFRDVLEKYHSGGFPGDFVEKLR